MLSGFHTNLGDAVYTGKLEHGLVWDKRPHGLPDHILSVGQVSDDTEMASCIVETLKTGAYDRDKTIMNYMEWANTTGMMGTNTRKLLKGIKTLRGYNSRAKRMFTAPDQLQSNGSLMRCGVLAILGMGDGIETKMRTAVVEDCDITNPNDVNRSASLIVTQIISTSANDDLTKEELIESVHYEDYPSVIQEVFQDLETSLKLSSGEPKISRDIITKKGWVCNTLFVALFAFVKFDNYKEGIDFVVRQGGDTDTNACVAGYLLGAYYGFNDMVKVPAGQDRPGPTSCPLKDDVTEKNIQILMDCDTSDPTNPRPEKYLMRSYLADDAFDVLARLYLSE